MTCSSVNFGGSRSLSAGARPSAASVQTVCRGVERVRARFALTLAPGTRARVPRLPEA